MRTVQPSSLTTEELVKYAELQLQRPDPRTLTMEWQRELVRRLDNLISGTGTNTAKHDPRQLNLF